MIRYLRVEQKRYDTRMYCNLIYSSTQTGSALAIPLHFHFICPRGKAEERFPLLIYVGGGGWRVSTPERHLPELAFFASKGFAVASIEYRTTSNARFPAQIEDVKTAVRYFRKNCNQLRIDPDAVFIMGGSAGGYLAAMAALTGGTDLFRGKEYLDVSDHMNGAVCLYGVFDLTQYQHAPEMHDPTSLPVQLFIQKSDLQSLEEASPITYIEGKTVPFLLLHGTSDRMVPYEQSLLFHNRLKEYGNQPELNLLKDVDHADVAFSQPSVQKVILDFLKMNLEMK